MSETLSDERIATYIDFCRSKPDEATSLLLSQEAKIARMAEALRDAVNNLGRAGVWEDDFIKRHADALRDAGVEP